MTVLEVTDEALSLALFDAIPVATLLHDANIILGSNAAARSVLRAESPEDLEGLPLRTVVHPDGHAAGEQRRQLLMEHGQRLSNVPVKLMTLTGEAITATGSAVKFTLGGESVAIVAACTNPLCPDLASGLVLPPPAYTAETPLFAAALDAFPLPVLAVCDSLIVYVNRTTVALLRAGSRDQLVGRPVRDIMHRDAAESLTQQLALLMAPLTHLGPAPLKGTACDGSVVNATGYGCGLEHDGQRYVLLVATDATVQ